MIFLEHLLNLGSDILGISVLIRVTFKNLKDFTCQLLIVYESLFEITKPRLLPSTDHGRANGPTMTAQELHLCLTVHQALVLVLNGCTLGALYLLASARRYAVLVPLRGLVHALLAVEPLPERVLHGLPVIHDDYVGGRVNILPMKPHLLFPIIILIVLALRLQEHVIAPCLVQVVALGRQGRTVGGPSGGVVLQAVRGQLGVLVHVGRVVNLGQILSFDG
jgi:hypothetical protein